MPRVTSRSCDSNWCNFLLSLCFRCVDENSYFITSIVGMIGWGLAFITAIFMMIGVYQDLKGMLIPFIIVKIFIILVQCIILILYIVSLVVSRETWRDGSADLYIATSQPEFLLTEVGKPSYRKP